MKIFYCTDAFMGWREKTVALVVAKNKAEAEKKINAKLRNYGHGVSSEQILEYKGNDVVFLNGPNGM
ncbi:MAG: hypothetical protein HY226_01725 [Candidatus Vogelbacteria bacterium]|nr:hypothetical protein [Candidatus Vogelbacteria bacterium]